MHTQTHFFEEQNKNPGAIEKQAEFTVCRESVAKMNVMQ